VLKGRLERWAKDRIDELDVARPDLPAELDDRAQDAWEPLLAIADLAGDGWAGRARRAALALSAGEARDDEPIGTRLLADIKRVFEERGSDRLHSGDLASALSALEEAPWGDWRGKPLEPRGLARLLKRYGIKSEQVWIEGDNRHGYKRERFEDAFERYVAAETESQTLGTLEPVSDQGWRPFSRTLGDGAPSVQERGSNPREQRRLALLAFKTPFPGVGADTDAFTAPPDGPTLGLA
jgi:Protein of unknown function (DUF3631)